MHYDKYTLAYFLLPLVMCLVGNIALDSPLAGFLLLLTAVVANLLGYFEGEARAESRLGVRR